MSAVVTASLQPVSRELALDFAGVSTDELDEQEAEAVNAVFTDPAVQKSQHEMYGEQFFVPGEHKETRYQNLGVDPKSVNARISDSLMEDLMSMESEGK